MIRHVLAVALSDQKPQQNKQCGRPHICEKGAAFAQLDSAPIIPRHVLKLVATSREVIPHHAINLRFVYALTAVARGPPAIRFI